MHGTPANRSVIGLTGLCGLGLVLLSTLGCHSEPARFRLNLQNVKRQPNYVIQEADPDAGKAAVTASDKYQEITDALFGLFGSPDRPYIPTTSGLDWAKIARASGPSLRELLVVVSEEEVKDADGKKFTMSNVYTGLPMAETQNRLTIKDPQFGEISLDRSLPEGWKEGDAKPAVVSLSAQQRGLYRQHCVHCHGITGDGAGPTAQFLMPYPRDFRTGEFKFKRRYKLHNIYNI